MVVIFFKISKRLDGSVTPVVVDCAIAGLAQWLHSPEDRMELRTGHTQKSVLVRKAIQHSLIYFSVCLRMALVVFASILSSRLEGHVLVALQKKISVCDHSRVSSGRAGGVFATTGCVLLQDAGTCLFR